MNARMRQERASGFCFRRHASHPLRPAAKRRHKTQSRGFLQSSNERRRVRYEIGRQLSVCVCFLGGIKRPPPREMENNRGGAAASPAAGRSSSHPRPAASPAQAPQTQRHRRARLPVSSVCPSCARHAQLDGNDGSAARLLLLEARHRPRRPQPRAHLPCGLSTRALGRAIPKLAHRRRQQHLARRWGGIWTIHSTKRDRQRVGDAWAEACDDLPSRRAQLKGGEGVGPWGVVFSERSCGVGRAVGAAEEVGVGGGVGGGLGEEEEGEEEGVRAGGSGSWPVTPPRQARRRRRRRRHLPFVSRRPIRGGAQPAAWGERRPLAWPRRGRQWQARSFERRATDEGSSKRSVLPWPRCLRARVLCSQFNGPARVSRRKKSMRSIEMMVTEED